MEAIESATPTGQLGGKGRLSGPSLSSNLPELMRTPTWRFWKLLRIPNGVLFGVRTEPRCKPREGHETETLRVPGRFVGITKATLGPGRSRDGRDNLPAGGEFDVNLLTTTRETKTPRAGDSRRSALTHGSVEFDDRRKAPRSRPCRRGLSPGGERPRIPNIHGS